MPLSVMRCLASLLLLNGLLSFTSWWPTIAVKPDARLSPEFSILLVCLSIAVALNRPPSRRTLKWLAGFYLLLIVGRYVDVVAPSLFGRAISLYWDVPQLPRFIWVTVTGSPWWMSMGAALVIAIATAAFHWLIVACFKQLVSGLMVLKQTYASRPAGSAAWQGLWLAYLPLSALIGANYAGVQATWPYVSKPVLPTYMREVGVVVDALIPERANRLLPPSTVIDEALGHVGAAESNNTNSVHKSTNKKTDIDSNDNTNFGTSAALNTALNAASDIASSTRATNSTNARTSESARKSLAALRQRDLMLLFLESHGAVIYDNPVYAAGVSESLSALQTNIATSGRQVVSAFFTSATIGGASDLAHLSFLSGIDLSDPRRHDLLLTTKRPTLLTVFKQAGYDVYGVYHSVRWDWVERSYYGFDTYLSGPDFNYTGPEFGFWKIPDQFAMAKLEQMHPRTQSAKPRMTVMSTMSTHFPFVPVPPYQPDWARVLGKQPFEEADVRRAQAEQVNWMDMGPDYIRTLNYAHTWLAGWFAQPEAREQIVLMIGDHQPTSNIAGEGATWDVPVYVVTRDASLIQSLRKAGFSDGMRPAQRKSLGGLHELTAVLMRVFSGER